MSLNLRQKLRKSHIDGFDARASTTSVARKVVRTANCVATANKYKILVGRKDKRVPPEPLSACEGRDRGFFTAAEKGRPGGRLFGYLRRIDHHKMDKWMREFDLIKVSFRFKTYISFNAFETIRRI